MRHYNINTLEHYIKRCQLLQHSRVLERTTIIMLSQHLRTCIWINVYMLIHSKLIISLCDRQFWKNRNNTFVFTLPLLKLDGVKLSIIMFVWHIPYIYILQMSTFEAVHPYHGKAYRYWVSWQYLYYSCTWYTGKTYFAHRCIYAFPRPSGGPTAGVLARCQNARRMHHTLYENIMRSHWRTCQTVSIFSCVRVFGVIRVHQFKQGV